MARVVAVVRHKAGQVWEALLVVTHSWVRLRASLRQLAAQVAVVLVLAGLLLSVEPLAELAVVPVAHQP